MKWELQLSVFNCQIHRRIQINNDTNKAYEHDTNPVTAKCFPLELSAMAPKYKPAMANGDTAMSVIVHSKRARTNIILIIPNIKEIEPLLEPASKFWLAR